MNIAVNHELIEIRAESALEVFTKPGGIEPYIEKVRMQVRDFVPIIDTEEGRAEIRTLANKIAKSRTYIESVGKRLADEQKAIPKKIDAARKLAWDSLEALGKEFRKPLTDFEEAEKARVTRHAEAIQGLTSLAVMDVPGEATMPSRYLRDRIAKAEAVSIGPECEEFEAEYTRAKDAALRSLKAELVKSERYEAEQEELAALRAAKAAQDAKDRDAKIAAEAAERARAEQAAAFERQQQQERDAARVAQEASERREADLKRQVEQAERRAAEDAETARREREAAAAREKADIAAREANKQHCARINNAAVSALVAGGLGEDAAKLVVTLIAKRQIPSVTISY